MKNQLFEVRFDPSSGGIVSIVFPDDPHRMNWCAEGAVWGLVRSMNRGFRTDETGLRVCADAPVLRSFSENDDRAVSVYDNGMIKITAERFFRPNGNLAERFTVENLRDTDVFIGQDNFGVTVPLNDRYESADSCMVRHCNAHIWCGHHTAYVNALRMGASESNLGLVLTEGALDSYSVENPHTDCRGVFVLNSGFFALTPGGRYVLEWELFRHAGNEDFAAQTLLFPQTLQVDAENTTVFFGETIRFSVRCGKTPSEVSVRCGGAAVPFTRAGERIDVVYLPEQTGEYRFELSADGFSTYAEFLCVPPLAETVERRLRFIAARQQYRNEKSALHGAFLIYDNREHHPVFDDAFPDHNACRERLGMALLLAKYLQAHPDGALRESLDRYIEFLKREFYDEATGSVYQTVGRGGRLRLYNAPWVMQLFAEMYLLTGDSYYTDNIVTIVRRYYADGGSRFYPNGISFTRLMQVLRKSGNRDAEEMLALFRTHAETIIRIGTSYPPHEVTYEQTIVTPAVTLISDMGRLTGDPRYAAEAKKHVVNLERFNGHQPSYHLYELPVRYWDDFWFGKAQMFGDTFPHYWSCLTARSFAGYAAVSGEERYREAAKKCLRNCLCLYSENGEGSCAYVYPYAVDGMRGQFYDEWANDQDFALYFALCLAEEDGFSL